MRKKMIIILSLILIAVLSFPVYSEYEEGDIDSREQSAKYYDNAKVIRIKFVRGESFVKRGYNEGVEEASVNLSIFEGDSASTTDGRLEVYLGKLNYLRLDYDTDVKFIKVPALRRTKTTIHLKKGGIYLDISNIDDERDIAVQTEDCGLFVLKRGLYRINTRENGKTEIFVYNGLAEVAGTDYYRNVRENQKTVMRNGGVIERPFYFYSTDNDDFDQWNKTRMDSYEHQRYSSARYLNEGYEDHEYELTRSGRWEYNNEYNTNVWIPYNIGSSWRPYSNGRWVWHPVYGYVWTSYDTWGYYTHHYGRWHWGNVNGWYWLPGYRWSPAWVSWCGSSAFWGWSPLSYYNRPVVVINGRWNRGYRYRNGIPWKSRSMIIIKKSQLMAPRINRVSLKRAELSRITKNNIKYRGMAPNSRPTFKKVSVINARGNKITYKKGGVLSYKKSQPTGKRSIYKRTNKTSLTKYKSGSSLKKSAYKYSSKIKSSKPSSTYSSGTRYKSNTVYKKSPVRSSTSKYKYKYKSTKKKSYSTPKATYKSSTTVKKVKKKKNAPYSYRSGDSYKGYSSAGSSYSSKVSKRSAYSYKPGSTSYKSKYKKSSSSTPSYRSKYSSKTYSDYTPKSYKRSSSGSSSYKSNSTSSRSSRTYSRPSSSYKSSSSSSRSSSKSSSRSSGSSSKRSYKKK